MIDFVYPPSCAGCGKSAEIFCPDCFSQVQIVRHPLCTICGSSIPKAGVCDLCKNDPPSFSALRSWGIYNGTLRKALLSLKYENNLGLARTLAAQLAPIFVKANWSVDLIVPIPLCKSHRRGRGYNQSEQIAHPLSLELQVPLVTNAVNRIKETSSQVDLSRPERFNNLKDAFSGNPAKLKNKNVLLVDDIVTTGATLRSCSSALLDAGCTSVYCLTVAQTLVGHQRTL
jgi:ComF family protein